jgi:hypothetical protein
MLADTRRYVQFGCWVSLGHWLVLRCDRSSSSSSSSSSSFLCVSYYRFITSSSACCPQTANYCILFHFPHILVPLRSSTSCLRLLSRLPITSVLPFLFPSITCFRKQFLRKMWPFLRFTVCRMFLFSLTLCNTLFITRSVQLISSILLQHNILELSRYFRSYVTSTAGNWTLVVPLVRLPSSIFRITLIRLLP